MSKAEQTKAFIIEKTAPIFNKKGFAGTSLSDITEATGLTKGSIYGNFSNKDEVALAVFDYNLQKVNSVIQCGIEQHSSYREKLLAYANIYSNMQQYAFPTGGCPVLNTATEADDTHPQLKIKVVNAINTWKKKLKGIVEKGIEQKEFSPKTDAEQIAVTLIAMVEGGTMITNVTNKAAHMQHVAKSMKMIIESL